MLREECRLPYGVIQRYLKWRCGLCLSVGELVALVCRASGRGRGEHHRLQAEIRASPVVYGDETGWREDGRNGYLWSFSTPEVRCFLRRLGRRREVVAEVLGDEFEGGWSVTSTGLTTCIKGCIRDAGPICGGTSTG